jgi:hypothetical protein
VDSFRLFFEKRRRSSNILFADVFTPSTTQLRNLMLKFIQEYYPRRRAEMYELVQKIEDAKAHAEGREAEQMVMECDVFGKRLPIVPLVFFLNICAVVQRFGANI